MSGAEDADQTRRHKTPYTAHHKIPTVKGYREEKEARQEYAQASAHDDDGKDHADEARDMAHKFMHKEENETPGQIENRQDDTGTQLDAGAQNAGMQQSEDDGAPLEDTSETGAGANDPKAQRKALKKRKDERAERQVTDPVTHLPVKIHDLTSAALKEVPVNERAYGTTERTSTGLSNKKKSRQQLDSETKELQQDYESMDSLFPPPSFDHMKMELVSIYRTGVTVGLGGIVALTMVMGSLFFFFHTSSITTSPEGETRRVVVFSIWVLPLAITLCTAYALVIGVRDWMTRRIQNAWDDEVWESDAEARSKEAESHEPESVVWLNSLLASVWPLINPDLFTSLADTLEDVMQASLPSMVKMVSVNDIGQGSEAIRVLGVRWLPTGAAAQSVGEDGQLSGDNDSDHQNDRKVSGEGEVEKPKDDEDQKGHNQDSKTEQGEDGSQQQVAEGMEAEEGDFVNVEIAFAYRARSSSKSLKERVKDMHLYIAFYLAGSIKLPVWVDLRGIVGTMRMRLQLCPDPPFFSLATITFLGQPKVDITCTPLSKHALNLMDVPLISNFVQSAVDAAMAEYVAPKSLNLDLKDMLAGDDFKKDTAARGVLVVNIKRGYDFKSSDAGIPMISDTSSDPYVSVGWARFGKPVWSTRLMLNEMEPYWDETAYVLVTPEELNVDERIRIQLWDSDRMTADDDLGRIEVDIKEIMTRKESNGNMWHRCDGFRALKAGKTMPGRLEWCVGYYSKVRIQNCQLDRQTFDSEIKSIDQLHQKVEHVCNRKLREANIKDGRHKRDADELEQQKAQELKRMSDAMVISAPPPDDYPSGIFSIQIHQITGLELEKVSKRQAEKSENINEEAEEGDELPSAYCTVILNSNKVFRTRTKPKNAKPFYNAGVERYIGDWRNAEVYISVRDARLKEDDPLIGIVHLPLAEIFKSRSQTNGFYPLTGGVGYGRIRISMVWRSVQLQASPEAIGWNCGTIEVQSAVSCANVPKDLQTAKLKFHTDLGSGKMYSNHGDNSSGWHTKKQDSLQLPVSKRYASCLLIEFRHAGIFAARAKTSAFATLWLKDLRDETSQDLTLTVWRGDVERAHQNALPTPGENIGSITIRVSFWPGLGAAHSKWAHDDVNIHDVAEVMNVARNNDEEIANEDRVGMVDGDDTNSSDDENEGHEANRDKSTSDRAMTKMGSPKKMFKHFTESEQVAGKNNRGLMQWKVCSFPLFPLIVRAAGCKLADNTLCSRARERRSGLSTRRSMWSRKLRGCLNIIRGSLILRPRCDGWDIVDTLPRGVWGLFSGFSQSVRARSATFTNRACQGSEQRVVGRYLPGYLVSASY